MAHIFTQLLINGLIAGGIYSLVALGYTMVYGILKFINFAHGEIFMLGAYLAWFNYSILGLNLFFSFIISVVLTSLIGFIIEKIAYKPLRGRNTLVFLVTAIALSLFLQSLVILIFGAEIKTFRSAEFTKVYEIFGASITNIQIIIILVSIVLMFLLHLFIKKTKLGKAMRAVSDNYDTASIIGINIDKVISAVFIIGSGLAAVAGLLVGIEQNLTPGMGITIGISAFAAAVVGGIGNIYGAAIGGFLIGLIENFGIWFLPSGYKLTIAFVILLLVLLIKPTGLFGVRSNEEVRA